MIDKIFESGGREMNYSDNSMVECTPCIGGPVREENLQEMIARSVEISTGILKVTDAIRRNLFGEWPEVDVKEREIRCFTDSLRLQLETSDDALSQLRFIAERLGV